MKNGSRTAQIKKRLAEMEAALRAPEDPLSLAGTEDSVLDKLLTDVMLSVDTSEPSTVAFAGDDDSEITEEEAVQVLLNYKTQRSQTRIK